MTREGRLGVDCARHCWHGQAGRGGIVGKGESGTCFIGYAKSPHRIERMLENMFVGRPPGNYDRLLEYSHAVTGSLFFAPSAMFPEGIAGRARKLRTSGAS